MNVDRIMKCNPFSFLASPPSDAEHQPWRVPEILGVQGVSSTHQQTQVTAWHLSSPALFPSCWMELWPWGTQTNALSEHCCHFSCHLLCAYPEPLRVRFRHVRTMQCFLAKRDRNLQKAICWSELQSVHSY